MNSFVFSNKVQIVFGTNACNTLGAEVRKCADRVLFVYGTGSIKKNGAYDDTVNSLKASGVEIVEMSGVKPNPTIASVREGVKLCKENRLTGIVAVGGGSVLDAAKIIAAGAEVDFDPWLFLAGGKKAKKALPLFTVLTLAAAGSEMDAGGVITNEDTNEKYAYSAECLYPRISFLDPKYTYSVSPWQTACGVADMMSHLMEQYFGQKETSYLDSRLCEAVLKTAIHYGPLAVANPNDGEARSELMWASTMADNDMVSCGYASSWEVHGLEHPLSGYFDITHGAGLAVLTPVYLQACLNKGDFQVKRIRELMVNLFSIDEKGKDDKEVALEGIKALKDFFMNGLKLPCHLEELGVKKDKFEAMAEQYLGGKKEKGMFNKLTKEDVIRIYTEAF